MKLMFSFFLGMATMGLSIIVTKLLGRRWGLFRSYEIIITIVIWLFLVMFLFALEVAHAQPYKSATVSFTTADELRQKVTGFGNKCDTTLMNEEEYLRYTYPESWTGMDITGDPLIPLITCRRLVAVVEYKMPKIWQVFPDTSTLYYPVFDTLPGTAIIFYELIISRPTYEEVR